MGPGNLTDLIITGVGVVVWWLLRNRDARQQDAIETLFRKHDEDARRLDDFQLEIAKHHYVKPELDAKFEHLEISIREGMSDLGKKFDRLSEVLIKGRN